MTVIDDKAQGECVHNDAFLTSETDDYIDDICLKTNGEIEWNKVKNKKVDNDKLSHI